MESLLADGKVMELLETIESMDNSLGAKVKRFFRNIADLIRQTIDAYKGFKSDSTEGRLVLEMKDIYGQLQELFAHGIYQGGKNHMAMGTQKNSTQEGGFKYKLNVNAASELNKALYDKNYDNEVRLRDETPAIMLSQKGVRNLPMAMNASHIRENVFTEAEARQLGLPVNSKTHYHGLGEAFFFR